MLFDFCLETLLAKTAEQDVDVERVYRMKLCNELSSKANAKIQVVAIVCKVLFANLTLCFRLPASWLQN
jgi:hypothetical protein